MVLRDTQPKKGAAGSNRLVVLVHGWLGKLPLFSLADVEAAVREAMPDADRLVPSYPSGVFANTDLNEVCKQLADVIGLAVEARAQEGGSYDEIILIGFSLGSLVVRMTYLVGLGDMVVQLHGGFCKRYDWVEKVTRIILLAGNNRGWSIDPMPRRFPWSFYLMLRVLGPFRVFGLGKLIFSYQRGQPFVENLRIQWLRRDQEKRIPPTIQLFGEEEDLVGREDMLDQDYCEKFILIDVPATGHCNAGNFHEPGIGPWRRERFLRALLAPVAVLEKQHSKFKPPPEERLGNEGQPVTDVVFVIHGIRDYGDWTREVRRRIDKIAREHLVRVAAITPAYNRFSLLGFLLGHARRRNVVWFVNEYTTALARHREARFHFIGHSNGTYLLANALERYEMMRVNRVVFAGSVVRRSFPWDELVKQGRVERVWNIRAVDDLVVTVFPGFFEQLRGITGISLADLGGAGVFGFQDDGEWQYESLIRGGHSAAIVEAKNRDSLVRFVLGIDPEPRLDESIPTTHTIPARTRWFASFAWLVWLLLSLVPVLAALGLLHLLPGWPGVLALLGVVAVIWLVLETL